jgi:hypothetical protein
LAGKSHNAVDSDPQFLLLAIVAVIVDALLLRRSISKPPARPVIHDHEGL